MGVFVDVILAAAVLLAVFLGARSGLIKSLAGLIKVVASVLGASFAARVLADPVAEWLRPLLVQKIQNRMAGPSVNTASAGELLEKFGFTGSALQNLIEKVTRQAAETGRSIAQTVVDTVTHSIAYAAVFLVAFLVLLLVLTLVIKAMELAAELPGLKTLNTLGGAALGLIKGLLLVFFAVWVLVKLQLIITPELVEESFFLPFFVNYSPLSLLTGL